MTTIHATDDMMPAPRELERVLVRLCADDAELAQYVAYERDLLPEDIHTPTMQRAWAIIRHILNDFRTPTRELVAEEYDRRFGMHLNGALDAPNRSLSKHDIDEYVDKIRSAAEARRMIELSEAIYKRAYDLSDAKPGDIISTVDALYKQATEIDRRANIITPATREQLIRERQEERQRLQAELGMIGLSWGFDQLDKYTSGLRPGRVYVVGGHTGEGKSTFLISVAKAVSTAGHNVLYISQEMLEEHISDRELAMEMRVNSQHVESGTLTNMDAFDVAATRIGAGSLYVCDDRITAEQIQNLVWAMERKYGGIDLVVTDYLQEFGVETKTNTREQEIATITRAHRDIAKDFGIPVLTASQFNRNVMNRSSKKPQIGDFRESAAIEHVAWCLLGIYIPERDDGYWTQEQWNAHPFLRDYRCPERQTEIVIVKNRSGPRDMNVRIGWNPETALHYQPDAKMQGMEEIAF